MIEIAEIDARAAIETNVRILALIVVNALRGTQSSLAIRTTRKKKRKKENKLNNFNKKS